MELLLRGVLYILIITVSLGGGAGIGYFLGNDMTDFFVFRVTFYQYSFILGFTIVAFLGISLPVVRFFEGYRKSKQPRLKRLAIHMPYWFYLAFVIFFCIGLISGYIRWWMYWDHPEF